MALTFSCVHILHYPKKRKEICRIKQKHSVVWYPIVNMSSNYLCRLKWTWAFYGGGGPPTYALAPVRPHATCRREMGIHFGG